jgi:hypothetical protein
MIPCAPYFPSHHSLINYPKKIPAIPCAPYFPSHHSLINYPKKIPAWEGKFWIYEQVIRPAFYGIYDVCQARVDVYHLIDGQFQPLLVNARDHYVIGPLQVELGIWTGPYQNLELPWLRWWDHEGNLLLTGEERAEHERQRAERYAALLREQGIEPEA